MSYYSNSHLQYPLLENAEEHLRAHSGRPLSDISPDAVANGDIAAADLSIDAETLRMQAQIARNVGYDQLAANLLRAAELTVVPNQEMLQIYNLLRPNRASYQQLMQLATRLEQTYSAHENARFVREAAEVYRERHLLRE